MLNLIITAIEANADELQLALNQADGPVVVESAVEIAQTLVLWTGVLSPDVWVIRGIAQGGKLEFQATGVATVEEGLKRLRELV